ncbi:MAG TPA: DUF222 domain-containing protein [Nocardioidaceae bacterium]|nr:DUF222 domain-containing protein [Nocardioidaceae bacterium]
MTSTTTEPPATGSQPAAGAGDGPPSAGHVLVRFTRALAGALDRVEAASCVSMSEGEAAEAVLALTAAQARVAELRLRTLAAADERDVATQDASASTGAWLAGRTRQTRPGAHADVKLAKALGGEFEATRTALAAGTVIEEQARVIVRAVRALPAGIAEETRRAGEAYLLEAAGELDAVALKVLGRRLFEVLDPDEAERRLGKELADEERAAARKTFLSLYDNGDGTVSGRFKISAFTAAQLTRGLEALMTPRHRAAAGSAAGAAAGKAGSRVMHPDRHPLGADDWPHPTGQPGDADDADRAARERAEAERERWRGLSRPEKLGEAFTAYIGRFPAENLPRLGGVNATVVVTMTLEQLRGELEGACLLDTGAQVSASAALRLACEAGIVPAVLDSRGEPLHLGRKVRLHTPPQRLALGIRDKGCTAEGCTKPAWLAEAHHTTPWSQGGNTSVTDGVLLCPWHHHRAHDPRYRVEYLPTGKTRFHRRT